MGFMLVDGLRGLCEYWRNLTAKKTHMRRTILSAGFAIGLMLVVAAPASATAPHREFNSFPFSDSVDCGSFNDTTPAR